MGRQPPFAVSEPRYSFDWLRSDEFAAQIYLVIDQMSQIEHYP